ncbi:MAG: restriction endonuclease subunit S [bacterium]|nr:restriction endonuclease subunit S [bacterium]MDD2941819.1 restriction endonuclease subunit S [bacterium]
MANSMTTIGSVAEIFDGPHATPTKTNDGPFFLSISSLENGRLDLSKSAHLSEVDFKKWTKRVTPRMGDLLFSYETRLGEAALMPDGVRACLGRRMGLLRPRSDKVIPEYLLYAYLSPTFQQTIVANTITGATVDRIALNEMPDFAIRIPGMEEQKKVADLLKNIDAKIDCNNRINAELEAMAKALYDYWFVQYDFPDINGNPYKSSGGEMIFNTTLKREIPEGWCNSTIGSLISLEYGKGLKAENRTGSGYPVIGSNGVVGYHSDFLVKGPGIVVGRKGTVGAITFIHTDFFPIDTTYYVKPIAEIGFIYLKYLLSSLGLENMNSDSAVPGLNREAALRIPRAFPPTSLIQNFERRIAPLFNKMHISSQENQQLSQLREWLLPLLMNGQVSVVQRVR